MTDAAVESGTGRVRLSFRPEGGEVRVPAGTTVFDAASLERHRDRLDMRRARDLPQVQGARGFR